MAIKFEEKDAGDKPAKKEVGGKTYVAEEPQAKPTDESIALPFAKPIRPEKKSRKPRQ